MKKKRNKFIALCAIASFAGFALIFRSACVKKVDEVHNKSGYLYNGNNTHDCKFFDEQFFYKAVSNDSQNFKFPIRGGIIPHHLVASEFIADFYRGLKNSTISNIIIVGPNHEEKGNCNVITGEYAWDTPFGIVEPANLIVDDLKRNGFAGFDEGVLEDEHSISSHMPFIKYYLPQAQAVPIIFSRKTSYREVEVLAEELADYLRDEKTVIVASVDFSHYLPKEEAIKKDKESLEAIKNFNYERIYSFGNDNLDSPPSIATLLSTMEKSGFTNIEVLGNSNSVEILGAESPQTTSYFNIAFY